MSMVAPHSYLSNGNLTKEDKRALAEIEQIFTVAGVF